MVKHEGFSGAERPLFSAEILRGPETRGSAGKQRKQRKLGWENPGTTWPESAKNMKNWKKKNL